MADVASRDLRNKTRALLDRVEQGESLTITVDGRPRAILQPLNRRPRWFGRDEFARRVLISQADAELRSDLAALYDESTEDIPFR